MIIPFGEQLLRGQQMPYCRNHILYFPCSLQATHCNTMVLILNGNSQHSARVWRKTGHLGRKKIRFVTALDITKGLKQIG